MAQDKRPKASPPRGGTSAKPQRAQPPHAPHLLYCTCGTPMHPDHLEKHRGLMLERYGCPNRRWWNAMWHPHAWMEPRGGVPK